MISLSVKRYDMENVSKKADAQTNTSWGEPKKGRAEAHQQVYIVLCSSACGVRVLLVCGMAERILGRHGICALALLRERMATGEEKKDGGKNEHHHSVKRQPKPCNSRFMHYRTETNHTYLRMTL